MFALSIVLVVIAGIGLAFILEGWGMEPENSALERMLVEGEPQAGPHAHKQRPRRAPYTPSPSTNTRDREREAFLASLMENIQR